ncbi:MAG: hypothetical protein P4M02_01500, partial [Clostridia bacterium]|nr:hypothetical protein [Clostridia bacterium]
GTLTAYWGFYINGQSAPLGISNLKPSAGDQIVIAYGGSDTGYPTVTLSPQRPVAGETVTVTVDSTGYDSSWNLVTAPFAGANVTLSGTSVSAVTGSNGKATLKMPATAGNYTVKVNKDVTSGYPTLVRTEAPVTIYPSRPAGDDGSGYSLDTQNTLDILATGDVSARLTATVSGSAASAAISAAKTIVVRNSTTDFALDLATGTVISGASSWNGSFLLPQLQDKNAVTLANATVAMAMHVGADSGLSLSKPARLILPGMHGKSVGYYDADGNFRRITNKLTSDAAPSGAGAGFEGVYDNGADLIVYTAELGRFAAYADLSSALTTDAAIKSAVFADVKKLSSDTSKWAAFALARAGYTPSKVYLNNFIAALKQNKGDFDVSTDLSSAIIVLAANGYDPSDFCGVDLYQKLYNYSGLDKQGLGGPVYALLALDAKAAAIPSGAVWTTQKLMNDILTYQHSDGSFSISKTLAGDPDMTSMAILSLAPHIAQTNVKTAVKKAVGWLSAHQRNDGGFVSVIGNSSVSTSESVSTVIMALCSVGIDPKTDTRFVKHKVSLLDNLMSYKLAGGGFEHIAGGGFDPIASEQALMALTAYTRMENGSATLYNLTDKSPASNPDTGSSSPILPAVIFLFASAALLPTLKRARRRV